MDIVDQATRSRMMAGIRGRDTKPEMIVRRAVHALGYRFRLHRRDLPGTPDLVFPRHRMVVFVHGCFWHRHEDCRFCTTPASNADFWTGKFLRNVERDRRVQDELASLGWRVAVVWECQTKQAGELSRSLSDLFSSYGCVDHGKRIVRPEGIVAL